MTSNVESRNKVELDQDEEDFVTENLNLIDINIDIKQSQSDKKEKDKMQLRLVAGCIPILLAPFYNNPLQRIRDCPLNDIDCLNRVDLTDSKFLFINSRKNPGYYVFPKGGIKKREDPLEAALRETLEETGVEGEVFDTIKRHGSNWYLLSVKTVHSDWLEKDERQRIWVSYEDILRFKPVTKEIKKIIKKVKHLYSSDSE